MIYVDDMRAKYGRLIMCHMLSDSNDELNEMADKIGVARKWHQGDHYDICLTKKALAIKNGAKEITWKQAGAMNSRRKATGSLGIPEDAVDWLRNKIKGKVV
jgi:hypothetical protein